MESGRGNEESNGKKPSTLLSLEKVGCERNKKAANNWGAHMQLNPPKLKLGEGRERVQNLRKRGDKILR